VTTTPHDALFKKMFSSPGRAAELLRSLLRPAVAAAIEWDTLELLPGSFVDPALRSLHTDLLFAARMHGRSVRVHVLFEHLSGPGRWIHLRMLRYMTNVWVGEIEANPGLDALPPILPVVIRHGEQAWEVDTEFSAFVDCGDLADLLAMTPKFRFLLADLSTVDSEDLRRGPGSAAVRMTLLALKEARLARSAEELLRGMAIVLNQLEHEPDAVDVIERFFRYVVAVRGASEFLGLDIRRLGLGKKSEAIMETYEEYLLRTGRDEGRQEGRQEGRKEGGRRLFIDMLRAKFGEVPPEAVARVEAADVEALSGWSVRLVIATRLDEVFDQAH
jgi:predicted transposase YdaD